MKDLYLKQMLTDLKQAEFTLRSDISNRNNPFRRDGHSRIKDSQDNVDRLHELIRTYTCHEQHAKHQSDMWPEK